MNSSKNLNTVVEDIYSTLEVLSEGININIDDKIADEFALKIKEALLHWATPRSQTKGLRISNIGKPARQLWYDINADTEVQPHNAATQIKFLYGHLLEELILMLVRISGHTVTDEQKEVGVEGITGHMDCKIDGEVFAI